jgi:hypothetical protein
MWIEIGELFAKHDFREWYKKSHKPIQIDMFCELIRLTFVEGSYAWIYEGHSQTAYGKNGAAL